MDLDVENYFKEEAQKLIVQSILHKVEAIEVGDSELGGRLMTLSFEELDSFLQPEEANLVEIILKIDPSRFGFNGKHLGIVPVPHDLVKLEHQIIKVDGEDKLLSPVFIPRNVYVGYEKLNHAVERDLNHKLIIESAYRSPAYQILTLLHYLPIYEFDIAATAKRVAFPGYSEHGFPPRQAVDFMTWNGKPTDTEPLDFEQTIEFSWLLDHAGKFGFVLSYPKDNADGIMYEPWHWRFVR